jgi:transcriptional regulator with XRE-family HTH domain
MPQHVGARIKRLRQARGLAQRELAMPGVSHAYISRIEAGQRRPSEKALRQLAARLGTTPHVLEARDPWSACPHCGRAYVPGSPDNEAALGPGVRVNAATGALEYSAAWL